MANDLNQVKLGEVIKSLFPKTPEELTLFRTIVACAQDCQRRAFPDTVATNAALSSSTPVLPELTEVLASIPKDALHYFHGLVEAVEVYRSIHGAPLSLGSLTVGDKVVHELRQIRDLCLDEGLHSIY